MLQGTRLKSVDVAYMTAKANYDMNLSQIRVSRFAAWSCHVEPFRHWAYSPGGAPVNPGSASSSSNAVIVDQPKKFMVPTTFFPPVEKVLGVRQYQVLIFKLEYSWKIGVVLEIFRGALAKKKKDGDSNNSTRSMRVTKPYASSLKIQSVSKLKIVVLEPTPPAECPSGLSNDDVYQASCLSPSFSMDPHNVAMGSCVYGQLPVKRVLSEWPVLKIVLIDGKQIFERFQVLAEPGSRVRALSSRG